ncbi:MAG: shikimate dehydrogenase [Ruminococcaceae bacterium]|nr:shikimate dehydrogenase [Oscillospiraceae bacterium]
MERYALIGRKLGHSWSKEIHERYFALTGKCAVYEMVELEPDELPSAFERFSAEGFRGVNVTIPYKTDTMPLMDELSDEVERISALNTVSFANGKKIGYNSDYHGLAESFDRFGVEIAGRDVVLLGTGGASRAVDAICRDRGCKSLTYVSRTGGDGRLDYPAYEMRNDGEVLINCTPVGMFPNTGVSPVKRVTPFSAVVDLIYNPIRTELLRLAEEAGALTVNGLCMLVYQAIYSQAVWNGVPFEREIAAKIYEEMRKQM